MLKGDEPRTGQLQHLTEHCFDVRACADCDRGQRQVLRQGQRAVGVLLSLKPESLDAAQQDAGRDLLPAVQVDEGVAERPALGAVPLAEITGQPDAVLVHGCAPIRPVETGLSRGHQP